MARNGDCANWASRPWRSAPSKTGSLVELVKSAKTIVSLSVRDTAWWERRKMLPAIARAIKAMAAGTAIFQLRRFTGDCSVVTDAEVTDDRVLCSVDCAWVSETDVAAAFCVVLPAAVRWVGPPPRCKRFRSLLMSDAC